MCDTQLALVEQVSLKGVTKLLRLWTHQPIILFGNTVIYIVTHSKSFVVAYVY